MMKNSENIEKEESYENLNNKHTKLLKYLHPEQKSTRNQVTRKSTQ